MVREVMLVRGIASSLICLASLARPRLRVPAPAVTPQAAREGVPTTRPA